MLAIALYQGELVERRVIVDGILREHLARGGTKPRSEDLPRTVKKALANMKEKGLAENPSFGWWRIAASDRDVESPIELSPQSSPPQYDEPPSSESVDVTNAIADVVLGTGPGALYVYYLPTYRLQAESRGERCWPCKIGRTDGDPLTRVLSQAATALPERPRIALVIRTACASAWEAAMHGVLTLRGLRIEDSPGSEWFLTSPDDVLALAMSFDSSLEGAQSKTQLPTID